MNVGARKIDDDSMKGPTIYIASDAREKKSENGKHWKTSCRRANEFESDSV